MPIGLPELLQSQHEGRHQMTTNLSTAELYERGVRYFDAHDYITAAEYLAQVVADAPADVAVRLLLARAYYHSAQLTGAEQAVREVIARDPSDSYAQLLLGRVLQRQNRHAEATGPLRLAAAMSDYAV